MKKIAVVLLDDIDGKAAVETVKFGYRGKNYEIDLSDAHRKEFDDLMGRYIKGARHRVAVKAKQPSSRDVRKWAKSRGIKIGSRGRIPNEVIERYRKAA